MNNPRALLLVSIIALVTALLRFLPFIIFKDSTKTPKIITKLGKTLPYAVMAMLVVYCLKDVKFSSVDLFVPQLISIVVVSILYIWRRNTLLSIIAGTVCYMLLIQLVF